MLPLETQLRHNRIVQAELIILMQKIGESPESAGRVILDQYMRKVEAAAELERQLLAV